MLGTNPSIDSDDNAGGGSWYEKAVESTARSLEAAIENELGRTDNWWPDSFRTRLTVAISNVALAQFSGHLKAEKAADLIAQLRALQEDVETAWLDPEFRVDQMRAAVRTLAKIVVQIPLQ